MGARKRKPFGKELSTNQSIQFPLVELSTQAAMLNLLILKTATEMDGMTQKEIERDLGDRVSMCNYWGNRLCTQSADRAMQIHGGIGYSRHLPFEHIYRHHRRYRITEGSEEIQMRNVARVLFFEPGPMTKWDLYPGFKPPAKHRGIWDLEFNSFANTKDRITTSS